jgi:NADH-quinone oxidoreductase subunit L
MLLLIPLLPFFGFLVNAFLGRRLSKVGAGSVACAAMAASFGVTVTTAWPFVFASETMPAIEQRVFTWIRSGDFIAPFALRVDPLAALMILIVTGIGSMIHIYSTAYMHDEPTREYARYFAYLNLFAAFMLVLVLGSNFLVMFVGWEGVGLCSYLLIGFWYTRKSAADAGKKAFIVNRIGDFGFILGVILTFTHFGTLDFQRIAADLSGKAPEASFGVISTITLLLFVGATGKSAQIPLHVWLPDAMEGPTPVSALIHAATMVTAGVYLIGRNAVLFDHAPHVLHIVAIVGTSTALMAATIGLVQNDIKRVLAYSTVSQLGYMFLAMGAGAFGAGIFHLYTHAFFKALLFLGSGAVIHALGGEQDMRRMGGLKHALPVTYWTFLVGALALAGVPGLAGFFSKDEVLFRTFAHGHQWLWIVGVLTSLLTAIYMFRVVFMTFHGARAVTPGLRGEPGEPEVGHHDLHLHDAPPAMAIVLVLLAIGSAAAGYVGIPRALGGDNRIERFLEPSFAASSTDDAIATPTSADAPVPEETDGSSLERLLMLVSVLVSVGGIGVAVFFFLARREAEARMAERFAGLHLVFLNKYYVDEIYHAVIVEPVLRISEQGLWRRVDARLIDGSVNGIGAIVRHGGSAPRQLPKGSVRSYATGIFVGVVVILGYYLWR